MRMHTTIAVAVAIVAGLILFAVYVDLAAPATTVPPGAKVARDTFPVPPLTRAHAARLAAKSESVVRFLDNPAHRWLLATRREKCHEVPWERSCTIARQLARLHRPRARKMRAWLRAHDPVVLRLNRGLAGTPMRGLGEVLEREGRRYGVSPYFIAAAAGTESSFGAATCLAFNAWGLGNCGKAWMPPAFGSWAESIRYYARFIASRWPTAVTPYDLAGYAACDSCWGRKTTSHFSRFGVPAMVRYWRVDPER